jgi:hypothetical protein
LIDVVVERVAVEKGQSDFLRGRRAKDQGQHTRRNILAFVRQGIEVGERQRPGVDLFLDLSSRFVAKD